ncbi:MAG: hypothetical protein AAGJ81_02055 [Verrucomicrobiota bacterium]
MTLPKRIPAFICLASSSFFAHVVSGQVIVNFQSQDNWNSSVETLAFDVVSDVVTLDGAESTAVAIVSGSFSESLTDTSFSITFSGFGVTDTTSFSTDDFTGTPANMGSNTNGLGVSGGIALGDGIVLTFNTADFEAANPGQEISFLAVAQVQTRTGDVWEEGSVLIGSFTSGSPATFDIPAPDGKEFAVTNPSTTNQIRVSSITIGVIPEPSVAGMLVGFLALSVVALRRRRRSVS